jgi:exosortase/archaeosortase family protein
VHIQSSPAPIGKDSVRQHWPRAILICGPLLLLALEVSLLSPLVEFSLGWMGYLASPKLFNAVFLGCILFILLSIDELSTALNVQNWQRRLFWLLTNLLAFYTLLRYTLILEKHFTPQAIGWQHAAGWFILLVIVSTSAWLVFLPPKSFPQWLKASWQKAIGSGLLAITFVVITPDIQSLWQPTCSPTITLASRFIRLCGHDPLIGYNNNPVLGIRGHGLPITITQYCAEMESFAVFLLLAVILTLAYWQRVRKLRMLAVITGGIAFLIVLNAIRLGLLAEISGSWSNPQLAVALAHSRLASLAFWGVSLLILIASKRWWCPPQSSPTVKTGR